MSAIKTLDDRLVDACKRGRAHSIVPLVTRGANPNATTKVGISLLHWASAAGKNDVIAALLDAGADIHSDKNSQAKSASIWARQYHGDLQPIHVAAQHGHWETCRLLIARGANPNAREKSGHTPLHMCCWRDVVLPQHLQEEAVQRQAQAALALIKAGADVNAQTNNLKSQTTDPSVTMSFDGSFFPSRGSTPLLLAAYNGQVPMVAMLLQCGADPSIGQLAGGKTVQEVIRDGDRKLIEPMNSLLASTLPCEPSMPSPRK